MFNSRRKNERGAVAVFMALVLVVLMGITAVVIDLGMERVTRSDLQAARRLGGVGPGP